MLPQIDPAHWPQFEEYQVGDVAEVFAQFENVLGQAADPTEVTVVVRKPTGERIEYTEGWAHEDGTGYYSMALPLDQKGDWFGEWRGVGQNGGVHPFSFRVARSMVEDPA